MAVIPFPNLSPQGRSPELSWTLRSLTARHLSPLSGVATTLERPGAHWAARLPYANLTSDRRARLQTFVAACRGYASRFYVPVYGWTRRGSFSAPELLTNSAFSGTTGWSPQNSTLSAADGLLRIAPNASGSNPGALQNATVAANVPYALRSLLVNSGFPYTAPANFLQDPGGSPSVTGTGFGMKTVVLAPNTAGSAPAYCGYISDASGYLPSHYLQVGYSSMARCALVDNGPCFTQQSQTLDNAYWTKSASSVSANAASAADRTATADTIVENGAVAQHSINRSETRTAVAADWCTFGYFRRASGTRNISLVIGRDASNYVRAGFDLGAGTINVAASVTGDATNPRAFIVALGGGDYYCAVLGKLTATTGLYLEYTLASGTSTSYAGDSASGVHSWRCGAAQSGFPVRGMATTSAGDADGTLQTGSALYLKGLPVSTSGLLLQGDPAEVIIGTTSQLVRTRRSLNSDAAGMGYWEFEPPLRGSPADGAAVIICNPLCKMMLDSNEAGWTDRAGGFSDLEFAAVEDTYP